jgi:hypothetical protein
VDAVPRSQLRQRWYVISKLNRQIYLRDGDVLIMSKRALKTQKQLSDEITLSPLHSSLVRLGQELVVVGDV